MRSPGALSPEAPRSLGPWCRQSRLARQKERCSWVEPKGLVDDVVQVGQPVDVALVNQAILADGAVQFGPGLLHGVGVV